MPISRISSGMGVCRRLLRLYFALILLGASAVGVKARADTPPPRILFIGSYSASFPSSLAQIDGLRSGLKDGGFAEGRYALDVEFLDSKRFPYDERKIRLRDELRAKLKLLRSYDLVVTGDDNALKFALEYHADVLGSAPVVFLGVNDRGLALAQNANPRVTGVVEARSVGETLDLASRLFPSREGIQVIEDGTPSGRANRRQLEEAVRARPGLEVTLLSLESLTYEEVLGRIVRLSPMTPLFIDTVFRDVRGRSLDIHDFLARLRDVYAGPVFVVQRHELGSGALGGKVVSHFEQGRTAANLAAGILNGKSPESLPVITDSPNVYMFDDAERRRLGLAKQDLPPRSQLTNRAPELLDGHADWLIAGGIVFCFQFILIFVLMRANRLRRSVEAEARASEARFRAFFDNSPMVMHIKDEQHRIHMVNRRYRELYGLDEQDVIGKRGGTALNNSNLVLAEAHDNAVFESGEASRMTVTIAREDGELRSFIVTKFPIFESEGSFDKIGAINVDVTELKNREAELLHAKAAAEASACEARASARLAEMASRTKSEFLANMSHEIRTPMNGIMGMANALLATALSNQQAGFVRTIRDSGEALLGILNDILDLSKIEAGKMMLEANDFSVCEVLKSTQALWSARAREKGLTLKVCNEAYGIDLINADGARLRQILHNLVGNAIKFTESGGIEIRVVREARRDSRIGLKFSVIDTGIGIPEEKVYHLFDRFSQVDGSSTRRYGGTGLGLALSREFVGLFDGEIGVESEPGHGSAFWFTIAADPAKNAEPSAGEIADEGPGSAYTPVAPKPSGEAIEISPPGERRKNPDGVHGAAVAVPDAEPDGGGTAISILIAEDNAINQKVIAALLTPFDYRIDFVATGREAVDAVRGGSYDIVLMDIHMPEMDGVEATRAIRALPDRRRARVPIIALTANAMKGDRERYLASGMNDYVSKPIDVATLVSAIDSVRRSAAA